MVTGTERALVASEIHTYISLSGKCCVYKDKNIHFFKLYVCKNDIKPRL